MFKRFIMPTFLFKVERWKWNEEYRVYVSNLGHFKDEYKNLLSVKIDSKSYCKIKTNCGYRSAHRLVMLTWKPIPDAENLTVDHLDHNKRNNSLSNLEWVTKEENLKRAKEDFFDKSKEREPVAEVTVKMPLPFNEDIKIIISKETSYIQKDKNINDKANFKRKITDGHTVYNNAIDAANAIKKVIPGLSKTKTRRVANRIIAAIEYDKKYCEKKWYYVKEEE